MDKTNQEKRQMGTRREFRQFIFRFETKVWKLFRGYCWRHIMKGRLASRAHSFKENLLGAFGHSASPPSPNPMPPNRPKVVKKAGVVGSHSVEAAGSCPVARGLAKKTNSTDNLIEYSAPKSTDTLVKEVQFTLRYFEVRQLLRKCSTPPPPPQWIIWNSFVQFYRFLWF